MATLNFAKEGSVWVAEASVTKDYVLYMDRKAGGETKIFQRTDEGDKWAQCDTRRHPFLEYSTVCYKLMHGVYPVHIRIESKSEVVSAKITEVEQ